MFRLTSSHLQARQGVDPDIKTFILLWNPQRLQNKKYALYIQIKHISICHKH